MADDPVTSRGRPEVWAVLEYNRGKLTRTSLELISGGKKLAAKLSADFAAFTFGNQSEILADLPLRYKVEKIYHARGFYEETFHLDKLAQVLGKQINHFSPYLVLFGATQMGEELSLRVSATVQAPLLPRCESLEINKSSELTATRPVYGGHFSRESVGVKKNTPILATISPRKWTPEPAKTYSEAFKLIEFPEAIEPVQSTAGEILETIIIEPKDIDLSNADVVVGGGRGVGREENFKNLRELAELLKGAVGGSRVAVCNGWLPYDRQIGQSGKTIAPRLYIACGISGATHHQMGIKDSELIMVINTDKSAPIFKLADVGVVGDVNDYLPKIIEMLKARKEEAVS